MNLRAEVLISGEGKFLAVPVDEEGEFLEAPSYDVTASMHELIEGMLGAEAVQTLVQGIRQAHADHLKLTQGQNRERN